MAEQQQQGCPQHPTDAVKSLLPEKGPSTSQVLAVVTLLPVGGGLLLFSGLTLTGTLIGLAVATPLFLFFSPILVPVALALALALALAGFLTSGAFGITALSSFSWILNNLRGFRGSIPEQLEQARRWTQETAGQEGQRTKEAAQKAQETVRT